MSDDLNESGSELRRKLEEALEENRVLREQNLGYTARALIQEKGYTLVKPEDLQGVSVEDLGTRAEQLQQERLDHEAGVARKLLERQGLQGDALEDAVRSLLAGTAPAPVAAPEPDAWDRARSLHEVSGAPVPVVNPENLHGLDAIEFGFGQRERGAPSRP